MPRTSANVQKQKRTTAVGAAVYTRLVLSIYDPLVFRFENAFVWKCPSRLLLDHYNQHVSGNHLDVGVGTGYLLDNCQFPVHDPTLPSARNTHVRVPQKRRTVASAMPIPAPETVSARCEVSPRP